MSAIRYSFAIPCQIVFGWGRRSELPQLAAGLGRRVLLVCGSRTVTRLGFLNKMTDRLRSHGLDVVEFQTSSREPQVHDVDDLASLFRRLDPKDDDVVVAVGGGSTIDLAKAAAALATNFHGESVVDFLEGKGRGLAITERPLNLIALPTTAGTGAEATKNSVISSTPQIHEQRLCGDSTNAYKMSLRSEPIMPRIALVDPELTISVPPSLTAQTGMDAITQLIESYLSRRSAPIPQALVQQGLKLALPALLTAVRDGSSQSAREAMSHAALLSGMALANSGLGFAHGVAAALGITCNIPHGLACAVMLPSALNWNLPVRTRELAELERLFDADAGIDPIAANAFVDRIETLCETLAIPKRLRDIGVHRDQLPLLVSGSRGNSMSGNPREIRDDKLADILHEMW